MANLGLGLSEIRYRIATTLHLIVNQLQLATGQRRGAQITELLGLENDRYGCSCGFGMLLTTSA